MTAGASRPTGLALLELDPVVCWPVQDTGARMCSVLEEVHRLWTCEVCLWET